MNYAIRVYKEYFNFAASHFLIFENGSREPLHGHNYRVSLKGDALSLTSDMVFDFLDIKPIVRDVCNRLDHKLLLPGEHAKLKIFTKEKNYQVLCPDGSEFSFPQEDVLILPIANTSAERLAIYLAQQIDAIVKEKFQYQFKNLEVEVEETRGQCAIYRLEN
jgi:6-pyruvoyltetrahydropterin/6-carboxytetrahydropterin synthase